MKILNRSKLTKWWLLTAFPKHFKLCRKITHYVLYFKYFLCVRKCGWTVSLVLFDILHKDWFPLILEQGWMLILAWFLGWFYCSHNPSCIISIVDPCFPQSFLNSQSFVACNLTKKKEHYNVNSYKSNKAFTCECNSE